MAERSRSAEPLWPFSAGPAAVLLLLLLAVSLGACSGGGTEEAEPFFELFGVDDGDELVRLYYREFAEIEEQASVCMKQAGFEYRPVSYVEVEAEALAKPDTADADYISRWGYGIVAEARRATDEVGEANTAYFEGLDPAQRDVFISTLTGSPDGELPGHYRPDVGPRTHAQFVNSLAYGPRNGCLGQALEGATWIEIILSQDESMTELFEAVEQDSGYQELTNQWAACMSDLGYSFNAPVAAESEIYVAAQRLNGSGPPLDGEGSGATVGDGDNSEAWDELAAREIRIATDDLGCGRAEWDKFTFELNRKHAAVIFAGE